MSDAAKIAAPAGRWRAIVRVELGAGGDRIAGVQFLRGIAAFGVVAEHLFERYAKRGFLEGVELPTFATHLGETGVFAFFAISGFIMVYITARQGGREPTAAGFLVSRILRVAPLYYLTTVLIVAFGWATQPLSTNATFRFPSLSQWLLSFAFIPHRGSNGLLQPVYSLGWTLHYEMFFYGLIALGLAFRRAGGLAAVLLALCALTAIGAFLEEPASSYGLEVIVYAWTRPVMLYFVVGMIIALLRAKLAGRLPNAPLPIIAAVALVALLAASALPGYALKLAGISAALAATVLIEPRDCTRTWGLAAFARAMGDASYSIYLTHSFFLGAFALATGSLVASGGGPMLAPLALLACLGCLVAGWLVWRFVERPIIDRLRGRRTPQVRSAP